MNSTHTDGKAISRKVTGKVGDLELWDYKSYELRPKPDCAICQSDADVCLYLRKDA